MKIEYERKFLISQLPDLNSFERSDISQWYITPDKEASIRVRLYGDGRCYFDLKHGYGKSRVKNGFKIDFDMVSETIKDCPCVKKKRYKKKFGDVLMSVDLFDNGLQLVEIESDYELPIDNFNIPEWFGEEVTDNVEYRNNSIAYKNI